MRHNKNEWEKRGSLNYFIELCFWTLCILLIRRSAVLINLSDCLLEYVMFYEFNWFCGQFDLICNGFFFKKNSHHFLHLFGKPWLLWSTNVLKFAQRIFYLHSYIAYSTNIHTHSKKAEKRRISYMIVIVSFSLD